MKEKLKKILTCKDLWNYILEIICVAILLFVVFFSGFANGLLIENDIRDNMIVEINDLICENKNEKLDISFDKKNAVQPMNYNSTLSFEQNVGYGYFLTDNTFELRIKYYYYFNYSINSNNVITFDNIQTRFLLSVISYDESNDIPIYDDAETLFTSELLTLGKVSNEYFTFSYDTPLYVCMPCIAYEPNVDNLFLVSVFKNSNDIIFYNSYLGGYDQVYSMTESYYNWLISYNDLIETVVLANSSFFYNDLTIFYPLNSNLNFNITNFYGDVAFDAGLSQGGASQEELQQAWQTGFDIGYGSGVIEGKSEFVNSQEYRDILKDEFDKGVIQGIQQGIDSANDADGVFDRVFMVIRNAGASFLNLFDFYIFPNMPFYVVIAIPFIISSLFILFKILLK